jgi:hypothetical protein
MTRARKQIALTTRWIKPADDWSRDKAAEMYQAGYAARVIIDKLEAYGIGLYAAQGLVRNLQKQGAP